MTAAMNGGMMQLVIDAADDVPGVGLAVAGVVGLSATWESERNHSVELLPNIERLLGEAGRTKERHRGGVR